MMARRPRRDRKRRGRKAGEVPALCAAELLLRSELRRRGSRISIVGDDPFPLTSALEAMLEEPS